MTILFGYGCCMVAVSVGCYLDECKDIMRRSHGGARGGNRGLRPYIQLRPLLASNALNAIFRELDI